MIRTASLVLSPHAGSKSSRSSCTPLLPYTADWEPVDSPRIVFPMLDSDDYDNARRPGPPWAQAPGNREVVVPTTSVLGTYSGASVDSVRDHVRNEVKDAFKARGFKSEILGENGTWGSPTT